MGATVQFGFGENWKGYISCINEDRIRAAELSLEEMLGKNALRDKTFVDIGCGSGLFSLAALRLGASRVVSFDYDEGCVAAALEVKTRYAPGAGEWSVVPGSILDQAFVASLGKFDHVCSWEVLHHTGELWKAVEMAAGMVKPDGILFIALANDQGLPSAFWKLVKKTYNHLPAALRPVYAAAFFLRFWFLTSVRDLLKGRMFSTLRAYRGRRGMSAWHDVIDWVGGFPFEVASPASVMDFCAGRGFSLVTQRPVRGHGCNEFVFKAGPAPDRR
ncbi:MAG: methyltransferase domain-containing protein [Elusimicrobiales bacterium]|jgi:2-polyprenyl-6-hydroxyphenyl methylase/3-demethylubiquinone-9 3-methyltransferase